MKTHEHPQSTPVKDKQAIKQMLDHQHKPLGKPPQITQKPQRKPPTPAPQPTGYTARSSILDDAQGARRRAPAPTTTLPAQHAGFNEYIEEPDYTAPRVSVMTHAYSSVDQTRRPMSRSVAVSFPNNTASLNDLFNGRSLMVGAIALFSIVILVLFSAQPRTIFSSVHLPGTALTSDDVTNPLAPAQASASLPLAPNGEHTILGAPTITAGQIDAVLTKYNSPAAGTGTIWMELGKQYNINPAYALAFFIHESSAATASGWAGWKPDGSSTHNIGNIICAGYATCYNRFRDYPGWQEGIADWYRLISVEYVDGRGAFTVEQIIPVYAPSFENNVPAYVQAVTDLVQQWHR